MRTHHRLVLLAIILLLLTAHRGEELVGQLTVSERQRIEQTSPSVPDTTSCGQADQAATQAWRLNGPGWNGGDGGSSVHLPDGRVVWLFTDSFIGSVQVDNQRSPFTNTLIHNSLVVTGRGKPTTLHGSSQGLPSDYFPTPDEREEWYWPREAQVRGNTLQVFLGKYSSVTTSGEGGKNDIKHSGEAIATLSLPSLKIVSIKPLIAPQVEWGIGSIRRGKYTYIYGQAGEVGKRNVYLARTSASDLNKRWQYFTDRGWGLRAGARRPIARGMGSLSVAQYKRRTYLIGTRFGAPADIIARAARHPSGPFGRTRQLYRAPQADHLYTYNTLVHREEGASNHLLVSYNVNALEFDDVYNHADNFRPRFVRIPAHCLPKISPNIR